MVPRETTKFLPVLKSLLTMNWGKLRLHTVYPVSSISQHDIYPCSAPTSIWILEIVLGEKYRERFPMGGEVEWFTQGKNPGGGSGFETAPLRPCLCTMPSLSSTPQHSNVLPRDSPRRLGSKPKTANLLCSPLSLKAQQQDGHHISFHWLSTTSQITKLFTLGGKIHLQATKTFMQIGSWKMLGKREVWVVTREWALESEDKRPPLSTASSVILSKLFKLSEPLQNEVKSICCIGLSWGSNDTKYVKILNAKLGTSKH